MHLKLLLLNKFPKLILEETGGVTDDEIASTEKTLQVRFPSDYRDFLKEFGSLSVGPHQIFGLGKQIPAYLNLNKIVLDEWRDYGLSERLVPIFNNGGGDLCCIDLDRSSETASTMTWFRHDSRELELVADSFEDWLIDLVAKI